MNDPGCLKLRASDSVQTKTVKHACAEFGFVYYAALAPSLPAHPAKPAVDFESASGILYP